MHTKLIDADVLDAHLREPGWLAIDCRFDLSNPQAGEAAWREAHIPGAVYAHLEHDLSAPVEAHTGRHPLPDPDRLAEKFGAFGIGANTQVVAYDASGGAMAARLWWLLRWLGHERVAVLNGGWQAWIAAGFEAEAVDPAVRPATFVRRPSLVEIVSSDAMLRAVNGEADWRAVDARAAERFRGDVEPIDAIAGHIPGAVSRPFSQNLDADGKFLAPEILRERFSGVAAGRAAGRADRIAHYCGSGVTACHNVLAMEYAGLSGSRLYAGSWSEWIRDTSRPVEKGN